jgi:hypothetical protein
MFTLATNIVETKTKTHSYSFENKKTHQKQTLSSDESEIVRQTNTLAIGAGNPMHRMCDVLSLNPVPVLVTPELSASKKNKYMIQQIKTNLLLYPPAAIKGTNSAFVMGVLRIANALTAHSTWGNSLSHPQ